MRSALISLTALIPPVDGAGVGAGAGAGAGAGGTQPTAVWAKLLFTPTSIVAVSAVVRRKKLRRCILNPVNKS